ncbi:MAG TPA: response regulator [Thermoplasmata archaeon]|nr:response regulator [Thermoplasmata archaeon]
MRILVADDDEIFRVELAALLSDEGHEVLAVPSADAAVTALRARWYDVLLTDLRMPRKSGTVLLDEVSSRWPGVRSVILTGQPSEIAIASSLRHRAFNVIGKPFQVDQVLWVLRLVEEDLALGLKVAPPWDASRVPKSWQDAPSAETEFWGDPVDDWTDGASRRFDLSDGGRSSTSETSYPDRASKAAVLHFGWSDSALPEPAALVSLARSVGVRLGETAPVLAIADRRLFTTPDLLALWQALRGGKVPAGLHGAQGPQRREILRRLEGRELELRALSGEAEAQGVPGRTRLYLEHLVVAGLVELVGTRYRLTPPGEEVVELLDHVEANDGRLPERRWLYSEGPYRGGPPGGS